MGSDAGAVLELRAVLSLVELSVIGSELVVKEGIKSTTVAVVSAACLRGQGETKERVRERECDGHIVRKKPSGRKAKAHTCLQCK